MHEQIPAPKNPTLSTVAGLRPDAQAFQPKFTLIDTTDGKGINFDSDDMAAIMGYQQPNTVHYSGEPPEVCVPSYAESEDPAMPMAKTIRNDGADSICVRRPE